MRITDAKVIVCSPGRNFVTLRITTEDGMYGLGYATLNGRELAVASYLKDYLIPLLIGRDARKIEDTWQYLYKGAYWRRGPVTMAAIGAVDAALWDIKGKALNVPVYQLLGGASRDSVLVYGHASGSDLEDTVKAVADYVQLGYKAIRAQSGIPGLQSTYGVGRGKMYYKPAEIDAPIENLWSSNQEYSLQVGRCVTVLLLAWFLGTLFAVSCVSFAQTQPAISRVDASVLNRDVRSFLQREVAAHVADIKTLDPPPDRVVGALTTGEFSWGSFMRTLGLYSEFSGERTVAGRDVPQMIGKMAKIELSHGGLSWAQLYAAIALRSFGTDLNRNAVWQSLTADERESYQALLDPGRFYDAKTHTLIHLPENYFGVAARIAVIDYELGLKKDRTALDDLLSRAAKQFVDGAFFSDDALSTGRYDRYSNEYARAIYEAAEHAGRRDILQAVAPSLKEQMKLWWDLLSEDGYGYPWGRSLGAISYMDTLEIAAFLGQYPEFRPAPLSQLAAAYFAAWSWLRKDFNDQTHLLSIFAFGRGDYSYITKEREWQQTTTFLGKVIGAHAQFMQALDKEGVSRFPSRPSFGDVARFQYFRDKPGRKFGVWVVRQGNLHFALPFVTGPKAATSDYQPAPHGFAGFAAPVEKIYPSLVPFLELEDGRTIAATDGADEIKPAPGGKKIAALWTRWVVVGAKAGDFVDPGLASEVTWSLQGNSLWRTESLTASQALNVRRLWLAVPVRYDHLETSYSQSARIDRFTSEGKALEVQASNSDLKFEISAFATGNDPLGRGDRGPIPIHLLLQTKGFTLQPAEPKRWELSLSAQ